MRISNVHQGIGSSFEIIRADRQTFDIEFPPQGEVEIFRNENSDDVFLRFQDQVWGVLGSTRLDETELQRIVEQSLPRLCWLAARQPKQGPPTNLTIQAREFSSWFPVPGSMEIGVDERIADQVRTQYLRPNVSAAEILEWLTHQIILPPRRGADEQHRLLLSAAPGRANSAEKVFRFYGELVMIDIESRPDGRLEIKRLLRSRSVRTDDERRRVMLASGSVSFCDIAVATAFRGAAKSQLDYLVEKSESYLRLWSGYNELERESILRKARDVGILQYSRWEITSDWGWRFHLTPTDGVAERLDRLPVDEGIELETGATPPAHLRADLPSDRQSGQRDENAAEDHRPRTFSGTLIRFDAKRRTVDLHHILDDDEDEPSRAGYLFISLRGDRTRLARRERAEALIRTASSPMPTLGLLLEGSPVPVRRAVKHAPLSPSARKAFVGGPTTRQTEALRIALNTPDIALIQGPPGTGKTRVIEALQVRLAEIAESGLEPGSILLTSYQHDAVETAAERTLVLGLPPNKVGRRRGQRDAQSSVDRWSREIANVVRVDMATRGEYPVSAVLRRVQTMAIGLSRTPASPSEAAILLRDVAAQIAGYVPGTLRDRVAARADELQRRARELLPDESGERERARRATFGLRTDGTAFLDDGALAALRALRSFAGVVSLDSSEHDLLEQAANWTEEAIPPFLGDLEVVRTVLLDRLAPKGRVNAAPVADADTGQLLGDVVSALDHALRESRSGVDAVLSEYLDDLDNDPTGVQQALSDYTVVLAATCQQAAGGHMRLAKGVDREDVIFDSVIVDEAARANPLDLFIPLAMARRRIILVGDHRQLPHILEPDVERELKKSTNDDTHRKFTESLFKKLFFELQARQAQDGVKRTITLDTQYRMHPVLGDFVSGTFYEPYGETIVAGRVADDFVHELPGYGGAVAAWIDVPHSRGREQGSRSRHRPIEAKLIAAELRRLLTANPRLTFGVIAFYRAQVDELWRALIAEDLAERLADGTPHILANWQEIRNDENRVVDRIRVGTVDAFQGKELMLSFCR